jgi:hypothetical protein
VAAVAGNVPWLTGVVKVRGCNVRRTGVVTRRAGIAIRRVLLCPLGPRGNVRVGGWNDGVIGGCA